MCTQGTQFRVHLPSRHVTLEMEGHAWREQVEVVVAGHIHGRREEGIEDACNAGQQEAKVDAALMLPDGPLLRLTYILNPSSSFATIHSLIQPCCSKASSEPSNASQ